MINCRESQGRERCHVSSVSEGQLQCVKVIEGQCFLVHSPLPSREVYFRRSGTGARGTKKTCSFCLQRIAKIEQTNLKTNSRARLITALKSYFGHELLLHHVLVQSTELNRRMVLTD